MCKEIKHVPLITILKLNNKVSFILFRGGEGGGCRITIKLSKSYI